MHMIHDPFMIVYYLPNDMNGTGYRQELHSRMIRLPWQAFVLFLAWFVLLSTFIVFAQSMAMAYILWPN